MPAIRTALVIGAGLAGPAVARGLTALGVEVDLLEQRGADAADLGAGLLLTGNALTALDALGAGDAVRAAGRPVDAVRFADVADRELFRVAVGAAHGWPSFVSIHRAALRRALLDAPPRLAVRSSTTIRSIDPLATPARVELSSGERAAYDLVIGADGVQSAVREQVFGQPKPTPIPGFAGWRCVAASPVEIAMPTYFVGNGRTLLLHPLRDGEIYCGAGPVDETCLRGGGTDLDRMRDAFRELSGPAAAFLAALDPHTSLTPSRYWEIAQDPWVRGRCLLIGDAAHACAPTLAQGAAMAFEDAVVLCDTLREQHEIEPALARFVERRRPRVARVQRASRARMEANHVLAPRALRVRDRISRTLGAAQLESEWASLMDERPSPARGSA